MAIDPTQHNQPSLRRSAFELHRQGKVVEAETMGRRALAANQNDGPILQLLGAIALSNRRPAEALPLLTRATRLLPTDAIAWNMYGVALIAMDQKESAQRAFEMATELRPTLVEAQMNLGRLMTSMNRPEAAAKAYELAVDAAPDNPKVWAALLAARRDLSDLAGCLEAHRQLIRLRPEDARNRAMLLTALLHDESGSPEGFLRNVLEQVTAMTGQPEIGTHDATTGRITATTAEATGSSKVTSGVHTQSARRLRVGYLSAGYRSYPTARFIEPVLRNHNRDTIEVTLYSDVPPKQEDAVTDTLKQMGFTWRPLAGLTDEAAAAQVRADGIDVLVDLAGHMDSGRAGLLAHRAAPAQVSYFGWPATTGLPAMDWRITDSNCDPPGMTEHLHTEKLIRLDPCCWVYNPTFGLHGEFPPPANRNGDYITFAAFNRLIKVTPRMLQWWSRILDQTPDSRLIAIAGAKGAERAAHQQFVDSGFSPERVEVLAPMSRVAFLHRLAAADILLDTFPYNGMTTTCDALSLGMPVVTLTGRSHVSRVGLSLLNATGLRDCVATDEEMYVQRAVALATDQPRLRSLQAVLREQVGESPLAQGNRVAEGLEQAFAAMVGR